ncbi:GGDEF domain-containing protein [Roseivivax sp. THAF30]|uniref:GGDEF domain-containing protein n=1 Tax=Roseivivax sp. THAF30 TaxID=2587852 RepID=UPI001267E94E|nr:GGDEF domain-containing protein [Roseivivax sp. THAF30]QFT64421.1 putative diguanylate cyclase YedQ [Roseivivax sp. THAF30]
MSTQSAVLSSLRPMSLCVDAAGAIVSAGPTTRKVLGDIVGTPLFDMLDVSRPKGIATLSALRAQSGAKLHVRARSAPETPMVAQIAMDEAGGMVIDFGFGIGVAEAVRRHGLTAADFSATDLTLEILFLIEAQQAAMAASRKLNRRLHVARLAAETEATTDGLTGLANRRAADLTLRTLEAGETPFSLVHVDLDFFKQVNDRFGHRAGDTVLQDVARDLTKAVRPGDLAARIGGDEFLLVFPGLADADQLIRLCERLIGRIERERRMNDRIYAISASAGIALWHGGSDVSTEDLMGQADRALYASKAAGRGRVTLAEPRCQPPPDVSPKAPGNFADGS